jgi:hypothetical protein
VSVLDWCTQPELRKSQVSVSRAAAQRSELFHLCTNLPIKHRQLLHLNIHLHTLHIGPGAGNCIYFDGQDRSDALKGRLGEGKRDVREGLADQSAAGYIDTINEGGQDRPYF